MGLFRLLRAIEVTTLCNARRSPFFSSYKSARAWNCTSNAAKMCQNPIRRASSKWNSHVKRGGNRYGSSST